MQPIPLGARGTYAMRVMPEHLANRFKDAILPEVLATPVMVSMMENAALNALKRYLDPGEIAVGIEVNVKHLAATPAGHQVEAVAEVIKIDGRRIEFAVSARDETEEIGRGSHARMAIDIERLKKRLEMKRGAMVGRGP
jgi:fluoroacetyl-CoA thioesterase